jgi:uncharacterized protein YjgD (DUF1641 family)
MEAVLRNLGFDIPELTADELDEKFNSIVNTVAGGNTVLGAIRKLTADNLSQTFILERNLWQIGDVLVQILTELGGVFIHPDFDQGISAPFEKQTTGLIGSLQRIEDAVKKQTGMDAGGIVDALNSIDASVYFNTFTLERNLWEIGGVLVEIRDGLASVPSFDTGELIKITEAVNRVNESVNKEMLNDSQGIINALNTINDSVYFNTYTLEQNLWLIGGVLVEIRDALGSVESFATGGPITNTGLANVHSGEFVVPRSGALVSSDPETKAVLERVDLRLRNLERISESGFNAVTNEEQQTRQEIRRQRATVRA